MSLLPEIGGLELLLIGIVGLLVLGPQDFPQVLRTAGRLVAQVRAQAARFHRELMELTPRPELEEVRTEVERLRLVSALDPFSQATGWGADPVETAPLRGDVRPAEPAGASGADAVR